MYRTVGRYAFYDEPPAMTIDNYEAVIRKFADRVGRSPLVRSVMQAGSVSMPGASDLDFIVVLKDGVSVTRELAEMFLQLRREDPHFFLHGPLVLHADQLRELHKFVETAPPRLLRGEPISVARLDGAYNLLYVIDLLNNAWPRDVFRAVRLPSRWHYLLNDVGSLVLPPVVSRRTARPISVRFALCKLNNAIQCARLITATTGMTNAFLTDYCASAATLRRNWFGSDLVRWSALAELLDRFPEFCVQASVVLSECLRRDWFEFSGGPERLLTHYHGFGMNVYLDQFEPAMATALLEHAFQDARLPVHVLPANLAINEVVRREPDIRVSDAGRFENYRDLLRSRDAFLQSLYGANPAFNGESGPSAIYHRLTGVAWRLKCAAVLNSIIPSV